LSGSPYRRCVIATKSRPPFDPKSFLAVVGEGLARLLLLLANFGKDDKPEPILAKISQETLADMIGTTRSRVSFFMNKFRKLGLIDYNGGIEVHSSLLNVGLHDEPHIEL
jgi:CRP/FNR family cyclic AMP-dependent transcriptional regulator